MLIALLFTTFSAQAQVGFVHVADSTNTFLHVTQIDHPSINNDPSARIIVAPNFNPDGGPFGISNPNYIGVFYSANRWNIYNENIGTMPDGAAFNILVAPPARSFIQAVPVTNPDVAFDHPLIVETGDTQFFVTHNRTPDGQLQGPILNLPFRSFFFFNPAATWSIQVPLNESMTIGTEFNVYAPDASFSTFDHVTSASNTAADLTRLDHPGLNGNPSALVWAYEHVPSGPSVDNNHPYAVAYDLFNQRWAIINTDEANFGNNVRFVVGFLQPTIFSDGFESGNISAWTNSVP